MNPIHKKDGLAFELNMENNTARITQSKKAHGDILIPRSIFYKSREFIITDINESSFEDNMLINEIQLPENSEIRTIHANAFASSSIFSINLPASVESLCEGWYKYTWRLNSIIISPSSKHFSYLDSSQKVVLGKTDPKSDTFDNIVFASRQIEGITIPSTVRAIGPFAFASCSNLKKIDFELHSNLNAIEKEAFSMTPIECITFPSKLREIGDGAFYKCSNLKTVNFERDSELISIGIESFSLTVIHRFHITSHVKSIGRDAFSKSEISEFEVDSLSEMEAVSERAFSYSTVKKILMPATVKKIESSAFAHCSRLREVVFAEPSELSEVKSHAFSNSSIQYFLAPKKVTRVEEGAFAMCTRLDSIEFLGNDIFIENKCFEGCLSLSLASFPNSFILNCATNAFGPFSNSLSLFIHPRALILKI